MSVFICGINEISFPQQDLNNLNLLKKIVDISFDFKNNDHINILKAVYYKYFVQYDSSSKTKKKSITSKIMKTMSYSYQIQSGKQLDFNLKNHKEIFEEEV